ncbi:MAG: hypothetical protein EBQ95_07390 [Gammaproteobacteria bacterium]|nr:hypothetical protein [Gammaproteobacteria bacterium]
MSLFNWLIRFIPSFPTIHQNEYECIKQECLRLIIVGRRIVHIPIQLRSPEDQILADNLNFYQAIIDTSFDQSTMPFIEWLEKIDEPQTSLIWSQLIQEHLWQPNFTQHPINQDLNLKFFRLNLPLFNQAYAFTGLIHAIFQQGYPCEKLLASGIVQDFFQYQISEIHILDQTHQQLENISQHIEGLSDYIAQINQVHCGLASYPKMSLLGKTPIENLTSVEIVACPLEIDNRQMLEKFLNLFEIEFIFNVLITQEEFDRDCIQTFLKTWIQIQADEDIEEIFHKIKTHLHHEIHYSVFQLISPLIPLPICQRLFTQYPEFFWILLSTAPQLREIYDKKTLRSFASKHAFNTQHIPFIAHLCTKPAFLELHDTWIQQILESYLLQSELELNESIFHIIKSFAKTKPRCQAMAKKWHVKLMQMIHEKTNTFTATHFIDIRDCFLAQRKIIAKIELLGYLCQENLKDHYDLTSIVLEQLLKKHSSQYIQEWLDILLPTYIQANQSVEENFVNKKRIVVELLKRRLLPNQELLLLKLVNILVSEFNVPFNKLKIVLEQAHLSIKIMALKSTDTMQLYLNLVPQEDRLKVLLSCLSDDNHKSMMQYAISNPQLLETVIQTLDASNLFSLLNQEYKRGEIWWHRMGKHSEILTTILNKLTIDNKITLLLKTNKFKDNIFHESIPNAESVEAILLHAPDKVKMRLLNERNFQNKTPFTMAFEAPACFSTLLNYLTLEQLMSFLLTSETSNSRFTQLLSRPELLQQLLQHLDFESKRQLITHELTYIVKNIIHQKETIHIIFNQFDGFQNQQLMKINVSDIPFARHLLQYPESFSMAYQMVNPNLRLNLIVSCQLLKYLSKPQWETLEKLIRGIPSRYMLNFFEYLIETQPKLIDVICADAENMRKITSCIPKNILWQVVSYKNSSGDNLLKKMPINHTDILTMVLQSFPETIQCSAILFNHEHEKSLFERAIHVPESFACISSFLNSYELYNLIKPGEYFEYLLPKCSKFESILLIFQNIPQAHQIEFLASKHLTYRNLLHGFFHEYNLLPKLIPILHQTTLEWMCQKTQQNPLYYREIHHKPLVLLNYLKDIPYPYLSQALLGLCYHFPHQMISNEIHHLFRQHHQPNSPLGRPRWFVDNSNILPQIQCARTYHDWLPTLEGDIKETHELSPRTRTA